MVTANKLIRDIDKKVTEYLRDGNTISYKNNFISLRLNYLPEQHNYIVWFNRKLVGTYKRLGNANNKMSYYINKYGLK